MKDILKYSNLEQEFSPSLPFLPFEDCVLKERKKSCLHINFYKFFIIVK